MMIEPRICYESRLFIVLPRFLICSQMYPMVVIEAFLMLISELVQFSARVSTICYHSFLGNSIDAMAAMILAAVFITSREVFTRTLRQFCLISTFLLGCTSSQ